MRSSNDGSRASNKYESSENDIQLQLGPRVTWWLGMLLRLPWAELKKYFITNWRSKQEATANVVTWKVECQKFWIQEQFQNKPEKVDFFKYISNTKKIQYNSTNSRTIRHPETLCMELNGVIFKSTVKWW